MIGPIDLDSYYYYSHILSNNTNNKSEMHLNEKKKYLFDQFQFNDFLIYQLYYDIIEQLLNMILSEE